MLPVSRRKTNSPEIDRMIRSMGKAVGESLPSVSRIARNKRDPFSSFMSTVLIHEQFRRSGITKRFQFRCNQIKGFIP